ncbi:NF-kappa-B inhibitor alpha-like [Megalops cyprinoides]|uniref:NF-kappa-B inhibitor alpha-like n=1 Tax=Megalops cyprinoides TaxID=118141 RepID=UPI001863FA13|nr:NF-kappa-B inhibitor alpha-like [Megalops cyprinoides]
MTEDLMNNLKFVSEDGDTVLHLALIHEQWDFVQNLLGVISLDQTRFQYLDIQNHLGQTALHLAVIVDHPASVQSLLCGGASPGLQERNGNTPLHLAVREGRVRCVQELTSHQHHSGHLLIANYAGLSALHLAVQKGNDVIIRMLLGGGADVDQRDLGSGRTPLHWAVESQSPEVVRLLLDEGAAVNQPTYAGYSPLYCALCRPNKDVQGLLQDRGGVVEQDEEQEEMESEEEESTI